MGRAARALTDRIHASVRVTEDGCWEWRGAWFNGYGVMSTGSRTDGTRRTCRAHRVSYEAFVGPIPEGYQIDHLCRNPPCVNPDHLQAVTVGTNARRRSTAQRVDNARERGERVCDSGHPQTIATTCIKRGKRSCRLCNGELPR